MSIAPRTEPAPSMAVIDAESFGNAVDLLNAHTETGSESIASLRIPNAFDHRNVFKELQPTMRDVVTTLWHRRPTIEDDVMTLRARSLPGEEQDERKTIDELRDRIPEWHQVRPRVNVLAIRHLDISGSGYVTTEDLNDIASLLCGHASLNSVEMQGNETFPISPYVLQSLGRAISLSNLRLLNLSNNDIGTRSMKQFLDNLHTPCLKELRISMTMQYSKLDRDLEHNPAWLMGDQSWKTMRTEDVWKREVDEVTGSLIQLLKRDQGQRAPFAPRLQSLSLNGNDLGALNAIRITEAVVESNFCLRRLEMSAVTEVHDLLHLEPVETGDILDPPAPELRRVMSIGSHMLARRRANLDQSTAEGEARQARNVVDNIHSRVRFTRANWNRLLNEHLSDNVEKQQRVMDASRRLLRTVRTLTCKTHEAVTSTQNGGDGCAMFPFARLPPEIRQRIVMHLEEVRWLHDRQTERIISFASEPTTIGYGHRSAHLGLTQAARAAIRKEVENRGSKASDDYGMLLHRPFRWGDVFARHSVPRDWPATLLEERMYEQHRPVIMTTDCSDYPPDHTMRNYRAWLAEQSGLQAFWEAVGTYAPEVS